MASLTEFPVKLIEDNLGFGYDGTVWAYYEIEGYAYDFRDNDQMKLPYFNQLSFLTKNEYDPHFLMIPYRMDGGTILDKTIQDVEQKDFPLKESGLKLLKSVKAAISGSTRKDISNQYHSYIGIQLDPQRNKYKEGNRGTQAVAAFQNILKGLNGPVRKAMGLESYDVTLEELEAWKTQALSIEEEISASFSSPARSLTAAEMVFITNYGFSLGNERSYTPEKDLGDVVTGMNEDGKEVPAVRPNKPTYNKMMNAHVVLHNKRTLRLRKVVEDKEKEILVRYLVIDKMASVNMHPGSEWLYRLQTELPFPIGVSIRAYHMPNRTIRKELEGAMRKYDDQRNEAGKVKRNVVRSVEASERGAIEMEEVFQKSGHPGYNCSFVIRVTAETETEMDIRVTKIRRMLDKFSMTFQTPYGDALKYFMEFVPTAPRESGDYWQTVSPGVLAGMMFGATTNIGDNRGFLIGFTKKLNKPVFLQPDLAAKDFSSVQSLFTSLSIMITGDTGKGKSVFMNLFAVLSALTLGSRVLIIDPKGDRKKWAEGLPYVPKEHIEIWTLGKEARDAGCLDPFRTATDMAEAKEVWMDIGSLLANLNLEGQKYTILSEAVEAASASQDPCGEAIMNHLEWMLDNPGRNTGLERVKDLNELLNTLRTIQNNRLAKLLFGTIGQEYRSLNVNKSIQVIMVENLQLPKNKTERVKPSVKISEAILISLTAFTKQFMVNTDRSVHKIILQDEAKTIKKSEIGLEQMEWIKTNGRFYNTTLEEGTQKASDHENASNVGMKATFQLPQKEEAERMLGMYNLPVTPNNVKTLQTLDVGECLFQDIYGRSAVVSVNAIFQTFLDAFDTSTSTKEEREREEKREKVEV